MEKKLYLIILLIILVAVLYKMMYKKNKSGYMQWPPVDPLSSDKSDPLLKNACGVCNKK